MEIMCKISVIIPIYNGEKYLEKTLSSVCSQSLKEIEIICIDDGSTDNSYAIVNEFAEHDSRIKVLRQENAGSGIARNYGITVAKGTFIAFMDCDDLYPNEDTLRKMYKAAVRNHAVICGGSLMKLQGDTIIDDPECFEPEYTFKQNGFVNYADYQFDYGYWRFIYRKDFIKQHNVLLPDYLRQQDPPFFIKAMTEAKKFYALKEATYVYRVSHKEIKWNERKVIDMFKSISDSMDIASENHMDRLYCALCNHLNTWTFQRAVASTLKSIKVQEIVVKVLKKIDYNILIQNGVQYHIAELYNSLFQSIDSKKIVSVILPVYNVEKYLERCLKTLLNQTMPFIEIICVNDGSADSSLDILKKYAAVDTRIKIINQSNGGLSSARNKGIENSQCEYLMFVDSDDWIDEDTIEEALSHMVDDVDIVSWGAEVINEGLPIYNNGVFRARQYHKIRVIGEHRITSDLIKDSTYTACNKLFKKSIIEKYTLRFTEGRLFEDNDFLIKYYVHCRKGFYIDRYMYHYVQRPHSIMEKVRSNQSDKTIDHLFIFDSIYQHFSKFDIAEKWKDLLTNRYSSHLSQAYKYAPNNQKMHIRECASAFAEGYDDKYFTSDCVSNVRDKKYYKVKELNDFIVSLTSYPKRINTVYQTIISLLRQEEKPDKILLWLATSQFPNKEKDLPIELLKLQEIGLCIDWCEDIKSYKKLLPTLLKYPYAVIITSDDDAIYDREWLKGLIHGYIDNPLAIHCYRAHKVLLQGNQILPYNQWPKNIRPQFERASYTNFFTGLGGVLYPPQCFNETRLLKRDFYQKLCPYGDDIWFWANAILNGVRIHVVNSQHEMYQISEETQDVGLWHENVDNQRNDIQIKQVVDKFPLVIRNLKQDIIDEKLLKNIIEEKEYTDFRYERIKYDFVSMQNSVSFRIGRTITWFPRKVRGVFWCFRDHGFYYTLKRGIEHMGFDMGTGDFNKGR